jgi:hypothetical protein
MGTFLNNSMAYQLGGRREIMRRGNTSASVIVARAKELLEEMDFVGFYEDLLLDYDRLYEAIFRHFEEDTSSDSMFRTLYMRVLRFTRREFFTLGTILARLRMRTLKYSTYLDTGGEPERVWFLIRRHTKYDMQVYEHARKMLGRPVNPFYTGYSEFFWQEIGLLPSLTIVMLGVPAMLACCAYCFRCIHHIFSCLCRCCCCMGSCKARKENQKTELACQ